MGNASDDKPTRHFFYLELAALLVTIVSLFLFWYLLAAFDPWDLGPSLQEFLGTLYFVFRPTSIFLAICAIRARKGRTGVGWLCLATVFVEVGVFLMAIGMLLPVALVGLIALTLLAIAFRERK